MRRLVCSLGVVAGLWGTAASAADLGTRPVLKAPSAPVVVNWTGIYAGGQLGAGWAKSDWIDPTTGFVTGHIAKGALAGGQLGFNYQIGRVVLGLEGDFAFANLVASHVNPANTDVRLGTRIDRLATITGRFGVAFDRALVYAKGGAAWAHERFSVIDVTDGPSRVNATRSGWTLGDGLEYAFGANWSARVEYDYIGLGRRDHVFINPVSGAAAASRIDQSVHLVKVGVNYRFGWGTSAVVARY